MKGAEMEPLMVEVALNEQADDPTVGLELNTVAQTRAMLGVTQRVPVPHGGMG